MHRLKASNGRLKDFFSHGSPFLSHPLLTEERTRREVDFLVSSLALPDTAVPSGPAARLLDVGCGFGRHSIELAQRDYQVVGIDPAAAMIEAAQQRAVEAGVAVTFQQVAGEDFVDAEPFDAAICLFTTLGQLDASSHEDNRGLLSAVARSLKPDARFALELPQKQPALAALKPADQFGNAPHYTQVQRSYEAETDVVTEQFRLVSPTGAQIYSLRYRLFSREDVVGLLTDAGLRILDTYAGYTNADLTGDSPFMLFVCARCL